MSCYNKSHVRAYKGGSQAPAVCLFKENIALLAEIQPITPTCTLTT